jgi:hypothetical protein
MEMDSMTLIILIIPFLLPAILFIILIRKGVSKNILIASGIIAAILYFGSIARGYNVIESLFNSVPSFFLWYCILEGIKRFANRGKKKEGAHLK